MGFQEDMQEKIEELKQYATLLEAISTMKFPSTTKSNSLGECSQDQNVPGVEKTAQLVKLQRDLQAENFHEGSSKALVSPLVQDSMSRNGLQFVKEPPMEEPPVEQSILVRSGPYLSNPLIKLTLDRDSGAKSLICMRLPA